MTTPGFEIAHASNRHRGARTRLAEAKRKLLKARTERDRLGETGAARSARVEAALAVEDFEVALALALADVESAELAERQMRDRQKADRLEALSQELDQAARDIDEGMIELLGRFQRHRAVQLKIAKVDSALGRAVAAQHARRLVARSASQHCGLERFLPIDGHRVVAHGEAPFASARCPDIEREVERLRGGEVLAPSRNSDQEVAA